ncbi:MAG: Uncharacterised protein [Crocinitomicaceae bacterium]|nr:MAG: Uncharacterised protein [Crocinitomicaceae bacterium]
MERAFSISSNNCFEFVVARFKYIILSIESANPKINAIKTKDIKSGPPSINFNFNACETEVSSSGIASDSNSLVSGSCTSTASDTTTSSTDEESDVSLTS